MTKHDSNDYVTNPIVSENDTILITQLRMKVNHHKDFIKWTDETTKELESFGGYVSQTITPPNHSAPLNWIILQKFVDNKSAKLWLSSDKRKKLIKSISPFVASVDTIFLFDKNDESKTAITEMISTKIMPQDQERFLSWNAKIAMRASTYSGFLATKLENYPTQDPYEWLTIVTFDSNEHLESWLNSKELIELINEVKTYSKDSTINTVQGGFGSWFKNGSYDKRSIWKENMIVLLTLYPITILLNYVEPEVSRRLPLWITQFIHNITSTVILGYITVPYLSRKFSWWLTPPLERKKIYTLLGTLTVLVCYGISLLIAWQFS